jgi:ABC-type transport system involved in Fe-S cluster assembly fused permease/ATPase subunit
MILFRMVTLASGVIRIDGKDISTMGLKTVRRALSIIPQVRIHTLLRVRATLYYESWVCSRFLPS